MSEDLFVFTCENSGSSATSSATLTGTSFAGSDVQPDQYNKSQWPGTILVSEISLRKNDFYEIA